MKVLSVFGVVAGLGFMAQACEFPRAPDPQVKNGVEVPLQGEITEAEDLAEEKQRLLNDLAQDPNATKQDFLSAYNSQLDHVEKRIAEIETEINKRNGETGQAILDDLKAKRDAARDHLARIKKANDDEWTSLKASAQQTLTALENTIHQAELRFTAH